MATNKRFSVVGVSTLKGKTKIRFANDTMRIKILQKNGHEDIDFVTLPHEMEIKIIHKFKMLWIWCCIVIHKVPRLLILLNTTKKSQQYKWYRPRCLVG